jgi:hypothetical protein
MESVIRVVRDRKGRRLVLLPLARYKRMLRDLEDRSDLAVATRRRGEKVIPYEEVRRKLGLT